MSYCNSCGSPLPAGAVVCPNCGSYCQNTNGYAAPQSSSSAPLVFGILALAFACTFYLSFLGIIFGSIGQNKAAQCGYTTSGKVKTGRILAKVGTIVGIVMTAILALVLILVVAGIASL